MTVYRWWANISVGFNRRYPCVCVYPALATCILLNLLILKMGLKPCYLLSSASVGWSQRQCFEATVFCRRPDRYQMKFRFYARVIISVGFNRRYQWAWFCLALAAFLFSLFNPLRFPTLKGSETEFLPVMTGTATICSLTPPSHNVHTSRTPLRNIEGRRPGREHTRQKENLWLIIVR